jgi:RHS repeat-associated protein
LVNSYIASLRFHNLLSSLLGLKSISARRGTLSTKDLALNYDAENRLVSVTGASTANFVYDADGKQVKATVNGVTTYYVGNHYEVKNSVVTKYYFAGATRLAIRTGTTLSYLLSDHLGSSSVTTDANGAKTASALYKAFGETRYTLGNLNTDYRFTGQREEASLGIYFFQSRWYDGALGRFLSPDSIVPTGSQGTQAWDRYAFVNNNPVKYRDTTGHDVDCGIGDYACQQQVDREELRAQFDAFEAPKRVSEGEMVNYWGANISHQERDALRTSGDFFVGFNMMVIMDTVLGAAQDRFPNGDLLNDPGDAFRHAYWSALMTYAYGAEFASAFSTAHETGYSTASDAREQTFMDLYNNNIGITIALANPGISNEELLDLIYQALTSGQLVVWDENDIYYSDECPECQYEE